MITYQRCLYVDPNSRECNNFFGVKDEDDGLKFCPLHAGILGPRQAAVSELAKSDFINLMNSSAEEARALIQPDQPLNLDALDAHIAALEAEIEKFKARASAARGVKADHMGKLSEDQRRELRKIKVPKTQQSNGKKAPQTQEAKEDAALSKLVKTLMATTGQSEADATASAKMILGL